MRRKSKELNIFSMSALDLFASALGAFILITLILIPYYKKETVSPPDAPANTCPAPTPIPVCPSCPVPAPPVACPTPTMPTAAVRIADNLLLMTVEWEQVADVDLHVFAPEGHYYYKSLSFPGSPGKFVIDNIKGGRNAIEAWKSYTPAAGEYTICANLYNSNRINPSGVRIKAQLDKPTGPIVFNSLYFTSQNTNDNARSRMNCFLKFKITDTYEFERIS